MTYSVIETFNELVNECVEAKKREHNGDVETCQIAKSYINGAYDAVLAVSGKEQADIFIAKVDKRFDKYLDDQWALTHFRDVHVCADRMSYLAAKN